LTTEGADPGVARRTNGGAWGLGTEDERVKSSAVGVRIKAPRRVGRGIPYPLGKGSVPPSQNFFSIFELNRVSFGAFWD